MSLRYLHFDIFGLALSDMATSTGNLSDRLSTARKNYFDKIYWSKDIEFIPDEDKDDFLELKKIIFDDVRAKVLEKHESLRQQYPDITQESLDNVCNAYQVIRNMHWKKAKKAVELISSIYFSLMYAVEKQARKKL